MDHGPKVKARLKPLAFRTVVWKKLEEAVACPLHSGWNYKWLVQSREQSQGRDEVQLPLIEMIKMFLLTTAWA